MAMPSPVPPNSLVIETSSCVNAENNLCILLESIPMPVSLTENTRCSGEAGALTPPGVASAGFHSA